MKYMINNKIPTATSPNSKELHETHDKEQLDRFETISTVQIIKSVLCFIVFALGVWIIYSNNNDFYYTGLLNSIVSLIFCVAGGMLSILVSLCLRFGMLYGCLGYSLYYHIMTGVVFVCGVLSAISSVLVGCGIDHNRVELKTGTVFIILTYNIFDILPGLPIRRRNDKIEQKDTTEGIKRGEKPHHQVIDINGI